MSHYINVPLRLSHQQIQALIPLFEWLVTKSGKFQSMEGRVCQNGLVRIRSALACAAKEIEETTDD